MIDGLLCQHSSHTHSPFFLITTPLSVDMPLNNFSPTCSPFLQPTVTRVLSFSQFHHPLHLFILRCPPSHLHFSSSCISYLPALISCFSSFWFMSLSVYFLLTGLTWLLRTGLARCILCECGFGNMFM